MMMTGVVSKWESLMNQLSYIELEGLKGRVLTHNWPNDRNWCKGFQPIIYLHNSHPPGSCPSTHDEASQPGFLFQSI